jgi:hypothetical protein
VLRSPLPPALGAAAVPPHFRAGQLGDCVVRLAVPLVLLPALLFVILRRGRHVELGGSL